MLSPAIFAERPKTNNPNEEPFLPIYPVYPYSPKLIKRGAERESISQLTPELYAPKTDAKDTYTASYSNNDYQRDSYYTPDYSVYPKDDPSPSTAYPSYDGSDAYAYSNLPYVAYNPYSSPYAVNPASYPTSSYPDYYYQPPYYYPHYFNHAMFPSPPPPPSLPSSSVDYSETSQEPESEIEEEKDKKGKKPKEDGTNQDAPSASQFVDGGNYISGNSKDLDVQSSTYKTAGPYNQVERDVQAKNLPIALPKTTYRVISVAGQPVGPDYPLPAAYVKAQQMEQLTSQTLSKLLAQNDAQQQAGEPYESARDTASDANDGTYANQDAYNPNTPSYVTVPGLRAKTGTVAYVIKTDGIAKVSGGRANPQAHPPSRTTSGKNTKYSGVLYVRKSAPQTTLDHSRATYVLPNNHDKHRDRVIADGRPADQIDEYDGYEAPQIYGDASSQSGSKQEQNYENYRSQSGSYRGKDFISATPQTPRSYSYQYSAYDSDQVAAQQPQNDKINSDDGNFGAKQYNKGW